MVFNAQSSHSIIILDELDHIAPSTPSLTALFTLVHAHASKLRVIGIANTHTLSSTSTTSLLAHTLAGVHTLHFAPYTPQQLFDIIQTRLAPLKDIELPSESNTTLTEFLPNHTLTLLTKKVAAVTGDVRTLLEVLRGAMDIAIRDSTFADEKGNPFSISLPAVSPRHVLAALKSNTPASSTSRPLPSSAAITTRRPGDNEVFAKIQELGLQSRIVLSSLLLARMRLDAHLPVSGLPPPILSLSKRARSSGSSLSSTFGIDVDALYTYYKSILSRAEHGIFATVTRSEFGDLLGMLETVGLIQLSLSTVSPSTRGRSGGRALARTTLTGAGSVKGRQEVKLLDGIRLAEIRRGLGIDDTQDPSDLRVEEVRAIWKKESARIAKEAKEAKAHLKDAFLRSDVFNEAMED